MKTLTSRRAAVNAIMAGHRVHLGTSGNSLRVTAPGIVSYEKGNHSAKACETPMLTSHLARFHAGTRFLLEVAP